MTDLSLFRKTIPTACTVTVLYTDQTLEAHVELDDDLLPTAGDRITVEGAPVSVDFGETLHFRRAARLVRGSIFDKLYVRFQSLFELTELYEVSFSTGRFR
ncbi:MAG: hypothetical protein AAF224_04560 [Pseudomonadota bacterium]